MSIIMKTRNQVVDDKVEDIMGELDRIERELVDQIKKSIDDLITMEVLCEIRNHIDNRIINWKDEELEI